MKARLLLLTTLFLGQATAAELNVNLDGINKLQGRIYAVVYNSEDAMKSGKPAFNRQSIEVSKPVHSFSINNVPTGKYAIVVFQDLNNDQKLGRNFIGIPTEPYGFSTNPMLFGAPTFKDIAFAVGTEDQTMAITLD